MTPHETNHIKIMSPAVINEQPSTSKIDQAVEQQELKEIIETRPFDSGFGFGSSAEDFDSPSDEFDNYELSEYFLQFRINFLT